MIIVWAIHSSVLCQYFHWWYPPPLLHNTIFSVSFILVIINALCSIWMGKLEIVKGKQICTLKKKKKNYFKWFVSTWMMSLQFKELSFLFSNKIILIFQHYLMSKYLRIFLRFKKSWNICTIKIECYWSVVRKWKHLEISGWWHFNYYYWKLLDFKIFYR